MIKEITENQFWQLVGIITASRTLERKMNSLAESYSEITGEEDKLNRFSDYVYSEEDIIVALKKHLPHDNVEVIWKTKVTEGSSK